MHIKVRNVNDAFQTMVRGIHMGEIPTYECASRVGSVLQIEEPVIITYSHPSEKVLFNEVRDANPFFHVYESLWMLAGRQDIAPMAYYSSNYAKQVQDGDSPNANGAYGWRWRYGSRLNESQLIRRYGREGTVSSSEIQDDCEGMYWRDDQLTMIVEHLKEKPESRRAVLSMWNTEDDLWKINMSRDLCCNLSAHFMIEQGRCTQCNGLGTIGMRDLRDPDRMPCPRCNGMPHDQPQYLNMTVFNRSNDLIWGALGANAVHFAFLLEYMAAHLGLEVGKYNQVSNNLHVYQSNWKPEEWLKEYSHDFRGGDGVYPQSLGLVKNPETFDRELPEFVERHSWDAMAGPYEEPFLAGVAQPLCIAFHHYKRKDYDRALATADTIIADDWRVAATSWLFRRKVKRDQKQKADV